MFQESNHFAPNDFTTLLGRAQQGCRVATGQIFDVYFGTLCQRARQEIPPELRTKEDPEDLVQETLLRAHCDIRHFRGQSEGELRCWLLTILHYRVVDFIRQFCERQKRSIAREQAFDHNVDICDPQMPEPLTELTERERHLMIHRCIGTLPLNQRRVIYLHDAHVSFSILGAELGITEDAARKLWRRAVAALLRLMQDEGLLP